MKKKISEIRSKISSAFSAPAELIKGAQERWKAFTGRISASAKAAFAPLKNAFNSLFGAALRNGLASLGPAFLSAITSARQMQAAIGHLKEGFAQMTAPIAQAVAPALAALTNGLATVLAYAGRLFGFLTGKTVRGAEGAASAVADVGKAAGGTAKRAEQATRSLAGFDEITRLDAPKAGAASGGGGGGSTAAASPGWAASSPFLDQVLATIEGGEWKRAGQLVAEKMDSLLQGWDAYAFGQRLGTGVQDALALLSGFITGAPWGDGERAMANGIERMLGPDQWNGLGQRLAEGFNGLLDAIDPADLAAVVFAKLNILVRTAGAFLENLDFAALAQKAGAFVQAAFYSLSDSLASVDWGAVGAGIQSFFQNLDWAGMTQSLGTMLGGVVRGAVEFMAGLLGEPFAFLKEKFLEGFAFICGDGSWPLTGEQIIAGILAGILNALAGIAGWIWENVFMPICRGFCDAFGIHSPSTVAAEWGGALVDGLLLGLKTAWQGFTGVLALMRQSLVAGWQGIRSGVEAVAQALWQRLTAGWQGACTALQNGLAGLQSRFASVWNGIVGTVQGAVATIQGLVGSIASAFRSALDAAGGLAAGIYGRLGGARAIALPPMAALPLPSLPALPVPALAGGAVLPANREFLAVLGDQRHGTNVEAPLATIQEAVRVELQGQMEAMMAGFEAVVAAIRDKEMAVCIGDDSIGRAAARYQQKMSMIKGGVY